MKEKVQERHKNGLKEVGQDLKTVHRRASSSVDENGKIKVPINPQVAESLDRITNKKLQVDLIKGRKSRKQNDLRLINAALKGDQKAYADLLARYRDSVFFVVLKFVRNRDEAEDLTIEAFGKAFNKLDKYSPEFAFSTWLFRIAINNAIDHTRKKRLKMYSLDDPLSGDDGEEIGREVSCEKPDPLEIMVREQRAMLLRQITGQLRDKYRTLIELRYFKEYSYSEIAEEMELPIGTVKAQLFRAKQLMANILVDRKHNY